MQQENILPIGSSYDLSALASDLRRIGRHKPLVATIDRAFSTNSAFQDLKQARDALVLLKRVTSTDDWKQPFSTDEAGTLAGSLFDTAIILYARATETKPVGRQPWFGTGKLDADQRVLHSSVMWIRNKELAHFGSGRPIDGTPMIEEAIALFNHGTKIGVAYRASRSRNRGQFAKDFSILVGTVTDLAETASKQRLEDAHRELGLAVAADPSLIKKIRTFPLSSRLSFTDPLLAASPENADGFRAYGETTINKIILKSV
ncbi:hypothetical protein NHF48_020070 [Sphingomonas sp. H160509]|uniref:hypothetical protein n=1 Tax=Sphingomonas sp. H160509 TaxID=2955313 RepID=UPI002097863B|nr:hypothetical protein [Sphingomonas sp. H160509]MDD1452708.1 hypothetical protein [Sphingomonas sp. H160509]